MFKRDQTKIVKTKNIAIGGSNDVIIQSMTTTKTSDVNSTLKQINTLYDNGSQ
jgi:(E)-4-hydroxy-3-methylbut-2-enyl-diphosphate synthase